MKPIPETWFEKLWRVARFWLPAVATAQIAATPATAAEATRPNVLFIAVDDLRPELACYGRGHIKSPNIDRLAASGVLFERAYCMVPTCGASRAALMTSVRPARGRFINYLAWAEKDAPDATPLHTHFKGNGYTAVSLGKVFHHRTDHLDGWSAEPWRPGGITYNLPENVRLQRQNSRTPRGVGPRRGPAFESADVPDNAYPDGQVADEAVRRLGELAAKDEPFFLAVGFYKPHLPFNCPKRYWDLYDPGSIRLPDNYRLPDDVPDGAVHTSGELRAYHGIPRRGPVDEETARNLIHGYYACVSFTDAQVGKVLDALDATGEAGKTVVVLWGDHGWNLGDHTMWCKHSCFESSLHAPLVVRAPGIDGGTRVAKPVEFIDIYPGLCELAGLPVPEHAEGRSLAPLLADPEAEWKEFAVSRYRNGDTIRSDQFRFTRYTRPDGTTTGQMLYDHATDPGENRNTARSPDAEPTVQRLARELENRRGKP